MRLLGPIHVVTLVILFGCSGDPEPLTDGGTADSGSDSGCDGGCIDADEGSLDASPDSATSDADIDDARPDDATPDASTADGDTPGEPDADEEWSMPERPDVSDPPAGATWRYGGGDGYPDMVDPGWPVVTVVASRAGLEAALETAGAGDIVYVDDDASIDLTGASLCIPGGVWLVGGRGREGTPGGLIFTTETTRTPLLRPCGDDVRISGLRILGADPGQCPPEWPDACTEEDRTGGRNCRDCTPSSIGIQVRGFDGLEVDNCELAGWSYAAVWLTDSVEGFVHHSHIHHTQRQGLGYGVVLTRGGDELVTALVEWNRFDYNRHAIAGSGEPGQDYEARHNLVLTHANGHVFDMHGENENTDNGSEAAGGEILVHHNTVLVADQYTLVVRGRPDHGAWLHSNCLARSGATTAALQRFFFGNFHVDESPTGSASNEYGRSAADCESVRFCTSAGAVGPWRYAAVSSYGISSVRFGDFDGDGRTDVFRADGSAWWWSRSGAEGWARLNTSSVGLSDLAFGDFDGDGTTDVFRATGREWHVSDSGSSPWRTLRSASERLDSLAFGDFDGNGTTDLFTANGSEWRWSSSGSTDWTRLTASGVRLEELGFGDFDSDGTTDVFRATGSAWEHSSGGRGDWERLNTSSYRLDALFFGDFDGDGTTDVIRSGSNGWHVSWRARSRWERLRITSTPLDTVGLADFDGDGSTDAFATGCL